MLKTNGSPGYIELYQLNYLKMSIVIFGDLFSFPAGGAATNRVHCYAKGFLENNNDVSVVCFLSTYNGNHNGQVDGIKYYYPWEEKERSKYFLVRS